MNLLFQGTREDIEYLPRLKSLVGAHPCRANFEQVTTVAQVEMYCRKFDIKAVFSTNTDLLKKLLGTTDRKTPSLDSYQGSYFKRNDIEYVFIQKLEHLITVNYASFLTSRYISKLTKRDNWYSATHFEWEILTESNIQEFFTHFQSAILIGVDIETSQNPLRITCCSYTGIFAERDGTLISFSCVLPLTSQWAVAWMRKWNYELQAPKVFQNGKYDNSYFLAYSAPVYNYLFDTANGMHCYYSELPKDLGFINAFFLREAFYFKDLAKTDDLHTYYKYNALDSWATANSFIAWMLEAPIYAKVNYVKEFPLVFPCLLAEMTGVKRDVVKLEEVNSRLNVELTAATAKLQTEVAVPGFNSNSHVQVKSLMRALGCGDIADKSSDEKSLKKAMYRHPLNTRIFNQILTIREKRKLISTYLGVGENAKEYKGRILYALNPHGTDTGRLASREHHFWCGLQIHNIPVGVEVKQTIIADEGFLFAEIDEKQAETRDTAYISGEQTLIKTVSSNQDFHSLNACAFFGRKYTDIWDVERGKTKDKVLRDLSKRTNHGATYVMGAEVLLDTMGPELAQKARVTLGLSKSWSLRDVCSYLLQQFHKTYPGLEAVMYPAIIAEIILTKKLVSPQGWTRYCFGKPDKVKRDKNAYVAHVPQNCNAMRLNEAWMKVFYKIALVHTKDFKLSAQIHDSILFQFRLGHEHLIQEVATLMEIPVTVRSYDKITRTYIVPVDVKAGVSKQGVTRWSEVEA